MLGYIIVFFFISYLFNLVCNGCLFGIRRRLSIMLLFGLFFYIILNILVERCIISLFLLRKKMSYW